MADFVICPRCRRQNSADAIFCNRCGVRLLSAGVSYRNRAESNPIGMSQLLLGLGVLVLAGLVLGGGAIVLLGGTPRATPTHIAVNPSSSTLPTLSPPPATPSPTPEPTPTLITTAPPSPGPSPTPTVSPTPTPIPTPINCAVASTGASVKTTVIGLDNATSRGPISKTWCIRKIVIHPVFTDGVNAYGTTRLWANDQLVAEWPCAPEGCSDGTFRSRPAYQVDKGSTLTYEFMCSDNLATADVDECVDATADGATITIEYEAFAEPF